MAPLGEQLDVSASQQSRKSPCAVSKKLVCISYMASYTTCGVVSKPVTSLLWVTCDFQDHEVMDGITELANKKTKTESVVKRGISWTRILFWVTGRNISMGLLIRLLPVGQRTSNPPAQPLECVERSDSADTKSNWKQMHAHTIPAWTRQLCC